MVCPADRKNGRPAHVLFCNSQFHCGGRPLAHRGNHNHSRYKIRRDAVRDDPSTFRAPANYRGRSVADIARRGSAHEHDIDVCLFGVFTRSIADLRADRHAHHRAVDVAAKSPNRNRYRRRHRCSLSPVYADYPADICGNSGTSHHIYFAALLWCRRDDLVRSWYLRKRARIEPHDGQGIRHRRLRIICYSVCLLCRLFHLRLVLLCCGDEWRYPPALPSAHERSRSHHE